MGVDPPSALRCANYRRAKVGRATAAKRASWAKPWKNRCVGHRNLDRPGGEREPVGMQWRAGFHGTIFPCLGNPSAGVGPSLWAVRIGGVLHASPERLGSPHCIEGA